MKLFFIAMAWLVHSFAWAIVPNELLYKSKPVDPLCFFQLNKAQAVVDLKKCGIHFFKGTHLVQEENKKLIAEGFVGYNYSWKLNDVADMGGYSFYKVFGKTGHSLILQTINNGGGTGSFSSLALVQRNGDKLSVSLLNGGDRSNGALVDVKRVSKKGREYLIYSVNLTAYDYLTLANDNPHHLKAYDDLSSCAVCCAGRAVYQREIGLKFKTEKLLYVDASDYLKDINKSSPSQPYQACFDKVLEKYGALNQGKLDRKQLLLFTKQFNRECA